MNTRGFARGGKPRQGAPRRGIRTGTEAGQSQHDNREAPRVLLVDDHELFRRELRDLLLQLDFEVVGEAAGGEHAVRLVDWTHPDVVLIDPGVPGISGAPGKARMSHIVGQAQVVALVLSAEDGALGEALRSGACGYLLKDAPVEEFRTGVIAAARGERLISPRMADQLIGGRCTKSRGSRPSSVNLGGSTRWWRSDLGGPR